MSLAMVAVAEMDGLLRRSLVCVPVAVLRGLTPAERLALVVYRVALVRWARETVWS